MMRALDRYDRKDADGAPPALDGEAGEERLAFDPFLLIPSRRLLLEGAERVPLGGRAFDLLEVLARHAGSMVSKEELLKAAWPDVVVQEGSLRVQINLLRKALRDGESGRRLIVNGAGRGYSLATSVDHTPALAARQAPLRSYGLADNLPAVLNRVVGRQAAIQKIEADLSRTRFVTVVGAGGIGKTTVALSAAAAIRPDYREGVWFVDLAPVADPALVPSVVASSLGLGVKPGDPTPDMIAFLRDRQLLLVLDNCEHVIDVAAALAETILSLAPHIRILATSREPLRAHGERVHHLPALDVPPDTSALTAENVLTFPAVQLFVDRMDAAIGGPPLSDEDAPALAQICRRLDGIALAIELAAGRVESLGISGVAAQLDDRFHLLSHGMRTATPRHRTLMAVFDWSYHLLPEPSQAVFRRLSVLAGRFILEAGLAVASDEAITPDEVSGHIARLVAASLVVADVTSDPPYYRLLDSARAYGQTQLAGSEGAAAACKRHAQFYLGYFEAANVRSEGWPSASWVKAYKPQLDNLRVALDWTATTGEWALRDALTLAAVPLLTHLSLNWECRTRVHSALTERPAGNTPDRLTEMRLLGALGMSLLYTHGGAMSVWTRCLEVAEQVGDTDYQLRALKALWTAVFSSGEIAAAPHLADRFAEVAGPDPAYEDGLMHDRMRGMDLFYRGRLEDSSPILRGIFNAYSTESRGTDVLRFQFDQTVIACVNLAKVMWLRGFPDQALVLSRRSVAVAESVDHELSLTYALAYVACRGEIITGNYAAAERYLAQLIEHADRDQSSQWGLMAQLWKGALLNRQGDPAQASRVLAEALQRVPEGSFGMHQTRFLGEYASALAHSGEAAKGLLEIRRAIAICDRLDERWFYPELVRIEGDVLLRTDPDDAAGLARASYRRALDLAALQGALSFELRAAISLARLDLGVGRSEGLAELRGVYDRFTEGFGTEDLVIARGLVDRIGGSG